MKINNEELRKIFRSHILTKISLSTQTCPLTEEIAAIFSVPGSGEEKEHIIDHIVNCSICVREFEAFLEILRHENNLVDEIDGLFRKGIFGRPFRPKKTRKKGTYLLFWRVGLATTLAAVFLAMIILTGGIPIGNKKPKKRGVYPAYIELLGPRLEQPASKPLSFQWTEAKGRDYFILEIFDESLSPLWKSPKIYENSFRLPPDIENKIAPHRSYFWMVTVFFSNGMKFESQLAELLVTD